MTTEPNPFAPPQVNLAPPDAPDVAIGPRGIGGWLLLPAFGLCVSPVRHIVDMFHLIKPISESGVWSALTTPGSEQYNPLWAPLLFFELVTNLGMLAFTLRVCWLFFHRSRTVPRLMVAWLIAGALLPVLDQILTSLIPRASQTSGATVGRGVASALIWCTYFLKSVRVKNTFTR